MCVDVFLLCFLLLEQRGKSCEVGEGAVVQIKMEVVKRWWGKQTNTQRDRIGCEGEMRGGEEMTVEVEG